MSILYYKSNKLIALILAITLLSMTFIGCNKQLDLQSGHLASNQVSWTTYEDARGGIFGAYSLLRVAFRDNYRLYMYGDVRGGDFTSVSRTDLNAVIKNQLNASYSLLTDLSDWRPFYATINSCNLFIENAGKCLVDKRYTQQYYKVDIAQAKIVRDFTYYLLVRNWGDVPFILNSYEGDFPNVSKTSANTILSYLENDILNNVNDLPWYYGSGANSAAYTALFPGAYYGQSNLELGNSLFGRVQAYMVLMHIAELEEHWDDVLSYSEYVVNNIGACGGLLYPTLSGFYASIDETTGTGVTALFGQRGLWKTLFYFPSGWAYSESGIDGSGHIEDLTIAYPIISKTLPDIYVSKDTIDNMFPDLKDLRFGIDTITGKPSEYYFVNYSSSIPIFKKILWQGNSGGFVGQNSGTEFAWTSNMVWTRIEEIMSLRAIAFTVLNGNTSTDALTILNTLRSTRGLDPLSINSVDLIDELFNERRRELIGEGWRWFDLVAYKKIKRNDTAFNKLIDEGGIYWPVSPNVLASNPNLTQNAYWSTN